jgi:hypothetical protein
MRLRHRKLRMRTTNYPCLCERQRGSLIPDVDPGPRQTVPNGFRRRKNELLAEPLGPTKARASPDCTSMLTVLNESQRTDAAGQMCRFQYVYYCIPT